MACQVMGPDEKLTLDEIVRRIQERHPYFKQHCADMRTTIRNALVGKPHSFVKVVQMCGMQACSRAQARVLVCCLSPSWQHDNGETMLLNPKP